MDPEIHDIRFVEDNWENPTLGAWGLGWEVWLNGMEVTQFTYFQQVGGLECKPVTGEITYGLERLAMYIQGVDSVYDLVWSDGPWARPPTATCSTRTKWSNPPTTSNTPTWSSCSTASSSTRRKPRICWHWKTAAAACLRAHPQGRSLLQPAGCPQGHLGHRASALHPAHSHPDQGRGRGILRLPRSAGLPDVPTWQHENKQG